MFETKRYMNTPNGKAMLKFAIDNTKAVVIGAGAGLSTSAGGFCAYKKPEIKWAFWSRNIWINRYMKTALVDCTG